MRYEVLRTAIVLGVLSACSSGDDVAGPPDAGSFTLTVAGDGAGSGRVATAAGVQPSLACDLAGTAAPAGTCSATYPASTAVALEVTPQAGSAFDGWAGDAAACGTATSCSLTLSSNQTAVARLSTAPAGLEVVSSAFYLQPDFGQDGAVIWVVEVRNPTAQLVETAQIDFTSRDVSGGVLASSSAFIGPIPPGQTRVTQGFADYLGTEATADFLVASVQFGSGESNLGAAEIVASDWRADAEGFIIWTVDVRNTSSSQLESVEIEFSTYDAAGKIVAASFTSVGPIAPGETVSGEGLADHHGTEATAKFQVASIGPAIIASRR